ncbi:MAG: nuclear transport factor 2 family protein [Pseudomonadota bacterium]
MAAALADIANQLVMGCREQTQIDNIDKLYADDAMSVEAFPMSGSDSRVVEGRAGIKGKHEWWNNTMEVHGSEIDGPYLHGDDRFSVIFEIDATNKENGQRMQMKEIAVYHVSGGKIVREEFFYNMPES